MLKVGGLWVSPAEIENVLSAHEVVSECAVVGHYDQAGLLKPKAFVCLHNEVTSSDAVLGELVKLCAKSLDAHKRLGGLNLLMNYLVLRLESCSVSN